MSLDTTNTVTLSPDHGTVGPVALTAAAQTLSDTNTRIVELTAIRDRIKRIQPFYDSGRYQLPDIDLVATVVAAWEDWLTSNP